MLAILARESAIRHLAAFSRTIPAAYQRGFATGSSSRVVELLSDEQYRQALKDLTAEKKAAVIDFTAKWCGPCKMIAPVYEKLSNDYPDIKFLKIDIDNPDLRNTVLENVIASVPTFIFLRGENRLGAISGADKEHLKYQLEKLQSGAD